MFHKPPGNDFEVYNDFNGLLVNLYRCVREKPDELMKHCVMSSTPAQTLTLLKYPRP